MSKEIIKIDEHEFVNVGMVSILFKFECRKCLLVYLSDLLDELKGDHKYLETCDNYLIQNIIT